jgi:hypothetical protein
LTGYKIVLALGAAGVRLRLRLYLVAHFPDGDLLGADRHELVADWFLAV